jgi:hypothetical protein
MNRKKINGINVEISEDMEKELKEIGIDAWQEIEEAFKDIAEDK